MAIFLYCNLLWLIAGFVAGVTSFGGNLVAVPLIALVLPPEQAILSGCVSGSAVFIGLAALWFKHVNWRETILVSLSTFVGVPLGVWFLAKAGSSILLLTAGASVVFFLLWQFALSRLGKREKKISVLVCLPLGVLSGAMMGAVGMGGPPLAICAYLREWRREETVATVNMISVIIMLAVLPLQFHSGLFDGETLKAGAIAGVFALAGVALSAPALKRVNIILFRRLLLLMLAFSALTLLARGLAAV